MDETVISVADIADGKIPDAVLLTLIEAYDKASPWYIELVHDFETITTVTLAVLGTIWAFVRWLMSLEKRVSIIEATTKTNTKD